MRARESPCTTSVLKRSLATSPGSINAFSSSSNLQPISTTKVYPATDTSTYAETGSLVPTTPMIRVSIDT